MSKTLLDCKTLARSYLDEASSNPTNSFVWDDTLDVVPAVNQSYHWLIGKIVEVYDDWLEDVSKVPFSYALVGKQQEYTVDSSLIKITRVEVDFSATGSEGNATRAVPIKKDEVRGNLGNTNNAGSFFSAGYYVRGFIGAQKIGFVPVPQNSDTGNNKSIFVWGVTLPSDLSQNTDPVNIPWADNFYQIIGKRAAAICLRKGQKEEATAARYLAECENDAMAMQTFLKDRQSDDGQYIEDSVLEQIDFSTLEII